MERSTLQKLPMEIKHQKGTNVILLVMVYFNVEKLDLELW